MPRSKAALSAFLLAANGLAQVSVTVPQSLTGVEGGSGTSVPFGVGQPVRYQCLYDSEELPWTGPRIVSTLSIRADNTDPNVTTFPQKGFVTMTLVLSTSSVESESVSTTFDDNHGVDRTVAFTSVPHMLPYQPPQPGVRTANIDLILPVPWIYGTTPVTTNQQPHPDSFVFELQIDSQPQGAYRIDNIGNCAAPIAAFGSVGPACAHLPPATPQNPNPVRLAPLEIVPGPSMLAGSPYTWVVHNAPPMALVALSLNMTNAGSFLGNPLPMPLFDPANPSLPNPPALLYPAADCYVLVQPAATVMGVSDTNGDMAVTLSVAPGRFMVGQSFFVQALAYSQTANPLQIIASEGAQSTVCGPLEVARIYSFTSSSAATGQMSRGQGAVIELR